MNERQFSNLFEEVSRRRGNTGEMLVQALEARFDNVIYRAGLVKTRGAARQAVSHAHFDVNGKKVNIPSYRVRAGDVITIRQNKRSKGNWKTVEETLKTKMGSGAVSWLTVDPVGPAIKVTGAPVGGELQQAFDPKMIVEFYSR